RNKRHRMESSLSAEQVGPVRVPATIVGPTVSPAIQPWAWGPAPPLPRRGRAGASEVFGLRRPLPRREHRSAILPFASLFLADRCDLGGIVLRSSQAPMVLSVWPRVIVAD